MIVVEVIPDRFSTQADRLLAEGGRVSPRGGNHVRRMTRGIVLKEETFATLRVVRGSGEPINIVDAGSNRKGSDQTPLVIGSKRATDVYSNFLLQQVQEERMEKQQIIETFGDPYIFLFGERARVISFTGVLANTWDFNWEAEWWYNYENYLRGTKCVENDARVFISFDNTLVGGYIISSAATKVSQERNWVQFQFQLFVTSYANFSAIGDPNANTGAGDLNGYNATLDGELSPAEAAVYRPNILTDIGAGNPPPGSRVTSAGLIPMNFADQATQNLIDSVSNLWNSASQIVDSVVSFTSQLLNGDLVRVPIGFAGTMAFDDDADVQVHEVRGGGRLRFSTFSDNLDEFVGSSDHYGTTDASLIQARISNFGTNENELEFGQSLVDHALEVWAKAGLAPPTEQMGPLTSFIARAGIGMLGVGATAAWGTAAETLNPDGLGPFAETQAGVSVPQLEATDVPNILPE